MTQVLLTSDLKRDMRIIANELENQRRAYILWLLTAIGIVSFCMTFLLLFINPDGIDLQYAVTFGALIPSVIVYLMLAKSYTGKSKKAFLKGFCKATNFSYRDNGWFSVASVMKHKILPEHNRSTVEGGIKAQYKNTEFSLQETILTALKQDPKHKKRTKEYLRFWGLLVRINLTRSTEGHTAVIPKPVTRIFFRDTFQSGYETLKIKSANFDKVYDIITTDKVETKFLLNSSFRTQFAAASKKMDSYWAEVSFKENEILLAFQRFRPLFEMTPLWKPVPAKTLEKLLEDVEAIAAIIDVLKANSQISL